MVVERVLARLEQLLLLLELFQIALQPGYVGLRGTTVEGGSDINVEDTRVLRTLTGAAQRIADELGKIVDPQLMLASFQVDAPLTRDEGTVSINGHFCDGGVKIDHAILSPAISNIFDVLFINCEDTIWVRATTISFLLRYFLINIRRCRTFVVGFQENSRNLSRDLL